MSTLAENDSLAVLQSLRTNNLKGFGATLTIYWRRDKHEKSAQILRAIADEVGKNSPIERAFAMREAAISAAKTKWAGTDAARPSLPTGVVP